MKRCRPPISLTISSPGLRCRWYALARIIEAPIWLRSSGSRAFTVASVPTGMKAGVSTGPCGVEKTPALAEPAVVSISKVNVTLRKVLRSAALVADGRGGEGRAVADEGADQRSGTNQCPIEMGGLGWG